MPGRFLIIFAPGFVQSGLYGERGGGGRTMYEGVSKSFRSGRLERELQMVQLSATRCSCIAM
jgi:hypothetical protein